MIPKYARFLMLVLVGLTACGKKLPETLPVGVRTLLLTDEKRTDSAGNPRVLPVEVWYPAVETGEPKDAYDLVALAPDYLQADLSTVNVAPLPQNAVRDAPVETGWGPYPILVFSHGNGGVRIQTYKLMAHLASRGFIVAAPDHVNNTLWEFLRDGGADPAAVIFAAVDRPKDVAFVKNTLDAPDGPLGDVVDGERWGVFGHSYGGGTSISIAAIDTEFYVPGVKAIMPLAPASGWVSIWGADTTRVKAPIFIVGGVLDELTPYDLNQVQPYEQANKPKGLAGITTAGHFSFADFCDIDLNPFFTPFGADSSIFDDGCAPANTDPVIMRKILAYFAESFFHAVFYPKSKLAEQLDPDAIPADIAAELFEYRQSGLF